jgi:hypothetical protein
MKWLLPLSISIFCLVCACSDASTLGGLQQREETRVRQAVSSVGGVPALHGLSDQSILGTSSKSGAANLGHLESNLAEETCRQVMLEIYQRHISEHPEAFGRYNSGMRKEIGSRRPHRWQGRDILGAKADMSGPSLTFEDVPQRCRNDESDQLIGLLRAFHLTRQEFSLALPWPVNIPVAATSPNYALVRSSIDQAVAAIEGRETEDCYSIGPPNDYECGSGLPEGWGLKLPYLTQSCTPALRHAFYQFLSAEPIWNRLGAPLDQNYVLKSLEAQNVPIEDISRCVELRLPNRDKKR